MFRYADYENEREDADNKGAHSFKSYSGMKRPG